MRAFDPMDRAVRQRCALFFAGRKKLVAHECNPKKRIADVLCYSAGVKRATGLVSAFKYMKGNSQRALDLLDREARQVCAFLG